MHESERCVFFGRVKASCHDEHAPHQGSIIDCIVVHEFDDVFW